MGVGMTDDQIASCWPSSWGGLPEKQGPKLLRFARALLALAAAPQMVYADHPAPGGEVVTMSPGGPGRIVPCLKCSACGHSVTDGAYADGLRAEIDRPRALLPP